MSDNAFLYHVLEDGKWHSQSEILRRSEQERGCGMTVHSRAADLRKKGCIVDNELRRTGNGRAVSYYRMTVSMSVALNEPTNPAGELDADSIPVSLTVGSLSAPAKLTAAVGSTDSMPSSPVEPAGALFLFPVRGAYGDAA